MTWQQDVEKMRVVCSSISYYGEQYECLDRLSARLARYEEALRRIASTLDPSPLQTADDIARAALADEETAT